MFVYPSSQNAYGKSNGIAQKGSNKEKSVFDTKYYENTMWKFSEFSATQILYEIN